MLLLDRVETVLSAGVVGPLEMSWGMLVLCMVTQHAAASSSAS